MASKFFIQSVEKIGLTLYSNVSFFHPFHRGEKNFWFSSCLSRVDLLYCQEKLDLQFRELCSDNY